MRKSTTRLISASSLLIAGALSIGGQNDNSENENYFSKGGLFIVSSSHQDTAWMDSPAACRKFRIENNIMPALMMMREDPNYTFCMECSLHAMEFLEAHPELRGEVIQRMKEGRLEFGATYNQPYESWLSGEELIRETYYGRRWIRKNLPGCDAKVAFNPDPPARSLQMQQILAKAGVPYMFISRYHEGLYRWLSPDGNGTLLYTPGHYGNHSPMLGGSPDSSLKAIESKLQQQAPIYQEKAIPPYYCLINSQDFSQPINFNPLIEAWNAKQPPRPMMQYSSIRGFFESIDKPSANFNTLMGERPDVWVYITGPTHHWTSSVKREAARLLPAAETFTTFASLLDGGFKSWPTKRFDQAWMDALYMDHGIGGYNGDITDTVFHRKAENARKIGGELLNTALKRIASRVKTGSVKGPPVVVFNSLSWKRSGPVELEAGPSCRVLDASGKEILSQYTTLGMPTEVNVALNAKATSSSRFNDGYGPEKAVDGRWDVRDPNKETGPSSKWNSETGRGPHWLTLDLGRKRTIHKVVIRHEGVIGAFGGETQYNTAAFRLQCADSANGPWDDLVAPVVGNTASLTVHRFAPRSFRFLRLYITKGAASDTTARIYEVQAFSKVSPKPKLLFMANDIPSLGYKTFYLAPRVSPGHSAIAKNRDNPFYRIALAPGGIRSIYDKQQKREMLDTSKFLGGEVFTMLSVAPDNRGAGTDAGEFGSVPLPVMDKSFDRVSAHRPAWKLIETGPVRDVYQLQQPLSDTTVRQRLIVWRTMKQLDCEVDLQEFNGSLWREFRMALPLASARPQISYEVPMGVVEIGKNEIPTTGGPAYGGLNYSDQCRDIHPRVMQNFVDASDQRGGITMSSSVSVFDWIDPTSNVAGKPILQPVLLASRKSCHGAGVWYPQAGDHTYRFALTTHDGGWRNGYRRGISANHPLVAIRAKSVKSAQLPVAMSFASISMSNAMISTIKKCEDDGSVIVRLYDMEGKASEAKLDLFRPVKEANLCNLIEYAAQRLLSLTKRGASVKVGKCGIETVKLRFGVRGGEESSTPSLRKRG